MFRTPFYRLQSAMLLFSTLMISSHFFSNTTLAWENPGWGNATQVCASPRIGNDSPDLGFKNQKNTFETGFYRIGPLPDEKQRLLGVSEMTGTVALFPENTQQVTDWLVTLVGADLYQISTCQSGQPRCLILSEDQIPVLGICKHEAYGTQAWWNIGIVHGPGKGGQQLGSDSVGRTECLGERPSGGILGLSPCETSGKPNVTWQFTRVDTTPLQPKNMDASNAAELITYRCESGERVQTYYDKVRDQMEVRYKGLLLKLIPVISGSGAKFGGSQVPWGWWTKANEGYIFAAEPDGTEAQIIDRCTEIANERDTDTSPSKPTAPTLDPNRAWTPNGDGENITLTDCRDCGDDIGMMVTCQGPGKAAIASINWAATDTPQPDNFITIEIDGTAYKRTVQTRIDGMLGQVPQFNLNSNDPIVEALRKSAVAKFTFGDITTHIGLTGSTFAFEIFDAHCQWKETPNSTDNSGNARWYTSNYTDEATNTQKFDLHFGVPETDNIALVASCDPNISSARIHLNFNTGALQAGTVLPIRFDTGTFNQIYQGQIFTDSDEYTGATVLLTTTDPLWTALAAGNPLLITPQSRQTLKLSSSTAVSAIEEWASHCQRK